MKKKLILTSIILFILILLPRIGGKVEALNQHNSYLPLVMRDNKILRKMIFVPATHSSQGMFSSGG